MSRLSIDTSCDWLRSNNTVANYNGLSVNSQQLYMPWGEKRPSGASALPTTYRYTGQRQESSLGPANGEGLYYYGARWYDPQLGRFTQPDTMTPTQQGVQAWDRFAYTSNNPIKYTDPSGHNPFLIIMAITFVAAVVLPWLTSDSPVAFSPTTPEEFTEDFTQRLNESAAILTIGTTIGTTVQAFSPSPSMEYTFDSTNLANEEITSSSATSAIQTYYPPNLGFSGEPQVTTLQPGDLVSRYGSTYGTFLSPAGTSSWARALPPGAENLTLNTYQVIKPIENVLSGPASSWWGKIGGGIQYYVGNPYGQNVQTLLDSGYLEPR